MLRPLEGFTVGVTADRRAEEQAELLTRRGAKVLHGPSIRTIPLVDGEALAAATTALIERPPDVLVLTTGLGTRGWLAAADGLGLDDALRAALASTRIVVRGPKAAGAALAAGLDVSWQATSEQAVEIVERLGAEGVTGLRIAVQRDGGAEPTVAGALAALGAETVDVPVYRWAPPDDPRAALRLVEAACDGRLDAVTFTSSPAVDNLFAIADAAGLAEPLREALRLRVRAVCVGPVCAATAARHDVPDAVQPVRARVGAMVQALVRDLSTRHVELTVDGVAFVLQGDTAVVGDTVIRLSARERAVLDVLAARRGQVVAKAALLERVWGPEGDAHTVEVTVARLRRRLGPAQRALRTVPRRGYVLDVTG